MKTSGIIVEYNPFHNGHLHHIEEARRITDCDVLVAVCSGNYCQRGDVSIVDKFQKCEAALEHGVDLVLELPYIYTVQSAYIFASKAIEILKMAKIDSLVFGSETNNLNELKKYSELEVDVTRLKLLMHDGNSYPKAYGLLSGSLYPNDMLAVAYLKALQGSNIVPISIQRTNDYHDQEMGVIASASAIRKALEQGKDINQATSIEITDPIFNKDIYPHFRRLMFTMDRSDLEGIFMCDEGIENLFKDNAIRYADYEDFMKASISRRYTRARIQRIMLHIVNQIKKKDVSNLPPMDYARVLGFNEKGQSLLKELKKESNFITQFKNIPEPYKDIEWKTSLFYSSLLDNGEEYLRKELKGPIVK